jgi:hypothetical protein
MPSRQHTNPLIIGGLTKDPAGHVTKLLPISCSGKESTFNEKWFQELLFKFPSLLPAAEIESAFHSLEAVAMELPIAGNWADLLFVNRDGCITLIETKLFRNPEARREVIAQAIDYACVMSGWNYSQLVQAVRQANKCADEDPLLQIMRKSAQDGAFDEYEFKQNVTRNLRLGRILILIVGDEIRDEASRMVEFIHLAPHLHFTLGLVEIALFRENEKDLDRIFVQPRVMAKTELHIRAVIEVKLPDDVQMRSEVRREIPGKQTRTSISEEQFFEELEKAAPAAVEFARWAISEAKQHQLETDWGGYGPSLKYRDELSGTEFSFGQLGKCGEFLPTFWLPKFRKLGLPEDIALDYLDDIVKLVPGSYRQERPFDKDTKTEVIFYPRGKGDKEYLPLAKLVTQKEKWFEAIDKAIGRIRKLPGNE